MSLSEFVDSGKSTVHKVTQDDLLTQAAALAYYAVFSLPATLLLVIYAAGVLFGQAAVAGEIENRISQAVGAQVASLIQTALTNAATAGRGTVVTIFAVGGLLFSATATFAQLQRALNQIWGVERDQSSVKSFAMKRVASFGVIAALAALVLLSLFAGAAPAALSAWIGWHIPQSIVSFGEAVLSLVLFILLFAIVFRLLPDVRIAWRDVWIGAIVTAALFLIGKYGVSAYITRSGVRSIYGAAGSLAILLLWSYFSAVVVLIGAEFVQAWSEQHGRRLEPEEGAIRSQQAHAR